MIKPEYYITFHGPDWTVLKNWLLEQEKIKIGLLIQAATQDESNKIRGSLSMIKTILALEDAAKQAAQRGLSNG